MLYKSDKIAASNTIHACMTFSVLLRAWLDASTSDKPQEINDEQIEAILSASHWVQRAIVGLEPQLKSVQERLKGARDDMTPI